MAGFSRGGPRSARSRRESDASAEPRAERGPSECSPGAMEDRALRTILEELARRSGAYRGEGHNQDHEAFVGRLEVEPVVGARGIRVEFDAHGLDGTLFHREHTWIAPTPDGDLCLWTLNSNMPGVLCHRLRRDGGLDPRVVTFGIGEVGDRAVYREEISIEIWNDGSLGYRYAWGLPSGKFEDRSSVRMVPLGSPQDDRAGRPEME